MAAQVVPALGEDRVELVVGEVQGHEHRGVDAAVDVERGGLLGREEQLAQPVLE